MRHPDDTDPGLYQPGDYGCYLGIWYFITPNGHLGSPGQNPDGQEGRFLLTEHEDGTITISPSIRVTGGDAEGNEVELYHGYLENGNWRDA